MFTRALRAACMAGAALYALPSAAQEKSQDLVITPNRVPMSVQQIGSAMTVITQEEIAAQGNKSLRDILDGQPGITVTESGGPGGSVSVNMRGTNTNHVAFLIDGMRVNDPTTVSGDIDLSIVPVQIVERIEIVRGPQSALYGSDSIGGVINIITKKGKQGPPVWIFRTEGGSYGTFSNKLSVAGVTPDTSYSLSLNQFHTDGFQRIGYRVSRLAYLNPNGVDPMSRYGGSGKVSKQINDWLTLETGFNISRERLQYDSGPYSEDMLSPNPQTGLLMTAYQKAIAESGPFRTTITSFETKIDRDLRLYTKDSTYGDTNAHYVYKGTRFGGEVQEDVKLGLYGTLTAGLRYERERAAGDEDSATYDKRQSTRSAFVLHQINLFEKLHLSTGGRIDDVTGSGTFATYRVTAAYDLTQTTRLRASYGTGAKAPSLYQLYVPNYNNEDLKPEKSRGFDVGFEQTFLADTARISANYFSNRIENLIVGDANTWIPYNVDKATTSGVEFGGEYNLVPGWAKLKSAYTHLQTRDESTGLRLLRRPRHAARMSVAFTPNKDLTIEPILRYIGERSDKYLGSSVTLKAYARFDVAADYKVSDKLSLFARGENLTNARYEDIYNYGTAGRSGYAGLQVTW